MAKVGGIMGRLYACNMFLFLAAIGLGVAFIVLSMSSRFFIFTSDDCTVVGSTTGPEILRYDLSLDVDIGWREFEVTYINPGARTYGCFDDLVQGDTYSIADFQDNSAATAGLGMVAVWGLAVVVAFMTLLAMCNSRNGMRKSRSMSLTSWTKWSAFFCLGIFVSTTVFWWLLAGKFGDRLESLAPRLFELITDAAQRCNDGSKDLNPCAGASYDIESPGWALSLGLAAMCLYALAVFLLWCAAARVDALNSEVEDELEMGEPVKPPVGTVEKQVAQQQPEEKARAKDRRSAKTGVRAGGRAPSSTVEGEGGPDPMTYALQEGGDEELGSQDDEEEEVVYQNHQVHHSVINHSNANRAQAVDDQNTRQAYNRGYSRGTSGSSFQGPGGQSFDDRSEADFSETASSAQYYAHHQGESFMSSSSRGESFDEYQ